MSPTLFICLQLLLIPLVIAQVSPTFEDVASTSGFRQPSSLKFGGPLVADIDNDGYYDVILSFHNKFRPRLFWGSASGTFTEDPFTTRFLDVHGVNVGPRTARSQDRIITVNVGGGNGSNRKAPEMFLVHPNRTITDISKDFGLGQVITRGRAAVFMDLAMNTNRERRRKHGGCDILFANFLGIGGPTDLSQYSYENRRGVYTLRGAGSFSTQRRGLVEVTDVDGDGKMEVISIRELLIYKLTAPFTLEDRTSDYMPSNLDIGRLTVTAVVELDYDNDGDMDLYVTTADRPLFSPQRRLPGDNHNDRLLENRGGIYVDVSGSANIPKGTNSLGVTAGDFNNDGFVDLLVMLHSEPDMILLNKGDGTFSRLDGAIPKQSGTIGNHAVAVDYNLDGKLDAIVGHGDHKLPITGNFLLMKNTMAGRNHYLHVKVNNAPGRACTNMHATVTLYIGRQRLVRRVGSTGAQAGGGSYIDTVHFGLGRATRLKRVRVRWSCGMYRQVFNVAADQKITFGVA